MSALPLHECTFSMPCEITSTTLPSRTLPFNVILGLQQQFALNLLLGGKKDQCYEEKRIMVLVTGQSRRHIVNECGGVRGGCQARRK